MAAGLTDRLWVWEEFLDRADARKLRKQGYG